MAVAVHGSPGTTIDASTSATTVPFVIPSVVTAGDLWICSAAFRMGSGGTISGVPSGFNLIQRVDQGSGSTTSTIVSYWYIALGTETGTWATITLSAGSKHCTTVVALTGANTTTPINGTVATGTGTTSPVTSTLAAIPTNDALFAVCGDQGETTSPANFSGSVDGAWVSSTGQTTTGGSGATNVGMRSGSNTAQKSSQTYTSTTAGSTATIMAFDIAAAAAAGKSLVFDTRRVSRNSLLRR